MKEYKLKRLKSRQPFVGRDGVDEDVTVHVDGVTLREDGVLILQHTHTHTHTHTHHLTLIITGVVCCRRPHMKLKRAHLSGRVDQLQVVFLTVHRHRLSERWHTHTHKHTHTLIITQVKQDQYIICLSSGRGRGFSSLWPHLTYCSLSSDHTSPRTVPPQTGWWEKTFLDTHTHTHTHRGNSMVLVNVASCSGTSRRTELTDAELWLVEHDQYLSIIKWLVIATVTVSLCVQVELVIM